MKLFDPTLLSSVGASAAHALSKRKPQGDDASPSHYQCDSDSMALDDPWRKGFTRRRLMQGGAMVLAAPLAQQLVTTRMAFAQTPGTSTKCVVVISKRGGADGLNIVVPHGDPEYYNQRGGIAIPQGQLLKADNLFGLSPGLASLAPFWDSGQFAAVHGVAMTEPNYSHFEATREYEQASNGSGGEGWLNRTLQSLNLVGTQATPFQAAQLSGGTPYSLRGRAPSLAIEGIDDFRLTAPEPAAFSTALASLFGDAHPAAQPVRNALDALQQAAQISETEYVPAAEYPDGGYSGSLREIARIIKAGVGLRIACVDIGGWDTHSDQGTLADRVADFADPLAAFLTDLGEQINDVTVITTSEFGRRIYQSDSGGTDHGYGTCSLVLGGGVNGGQYFANNFDLSMDEDGNVAKNIDYRDLFSELIYKRLGVANLGTVFPNYQYTDRGVFNQM